MSPASLRRAPRLLLPIALLAACRGGEAPASAASATERAAPTPTMQVVVTGHDAPYRAAESRLTGRVTGRVPLDPDDRSIRDTVLIPEGEERACGAASVTTRVHAVVWLDDVRSGRPLPLERRRTVVLDRCRIVPRLSQAWKGDALTFVDRDPVPHRIRITAPERGETLDVVRTLRDGSVVATHKPLARTGLLALGCDLHPGERGWVVVTDHPYVAEADDEGRFTLEGVPPGSWRVVAWHPKGGTFEGRATVQGDAVAEVTLERRVDAPPAGG